MTGARAKAARASAWLRGVTAVVDFSDNTKALYRALKGRIDQNDLLAAVVEWVHEADDPMLHEMNLALTLLEQEQGDFYPTQAIRRRAAKKSWGEDIRTTHYILVDEAPDYYLSLSDTGIEFLLGLR